MPSRNRPLKIVNLVKGTHELNVDLVHINYPNLTKRHGEKRGDLIEARFA